MTRSAGQVVDDAAISPVEMSGECVLKYATLGRRGASRDVKRCVRSFVGKHEWIYTVKASIYGRWRPGGLKY